MRHQLRWQVAGLALLVGTAGLAQPSIQINSHEIVATGITPKGQAVWFGVSHDRPHVYLRVIRREDMVTDEDGDGRVTLSVPPEVPPQSIWAVVDLTTGAYAVAAPHGSANRQVAIPATALPMATAASPDGLTLNFRLVAALLVRPGTGAWVVRVGKGGPADSNDRTNPALKVAFKDMTPLGNGGKSPGSAQAGDTVIVINPDTLEFFATRIGGKL